MRFLGYLIGILLIYSVIYVGAVAAETLVHTDTMRLKNIVYQVDGYTIVCHWLENPKLLSGKVNTGLSCVVLPKECPTCPTCPECPPPNKNSLF